MRVFRDENFLEDIVPTLNSFYVKCILPELLTRQIQDPIVDDGETHEVYCYCQQGEDGREMIGCDNTKCKYQWFHFDCVGLSKKSISFICLVETDSHTICNLYVIMLFV